MTNSIFMDKYPVHSLEIQKDETSLQSVDEIVAYFKDKIQTHPIATFITTFDHYTHTTNINGEINPDIKDAKNVIFCFGSAIPKTTILAARPRSIGICELENSFTVDFMEAPNEKLQIVMVEWTKAMVN